MPPSAFIVYFLPLNTQYSIQFSEGKKWNEDTLYAPFDFPIIKSNEELKLEKKSIESNSILYLDVNADISKKFYMTILANLKISLKMKMTL